MFHRSYMPDNNIEESFLPCEFCDILIPLDGLIQHQVSCWITKDEDKYRLYYAYMYMHGYVYGIIMYPTI